MEQQDFTPEQYKVEVMKQNFASRVVQYEDMIAELQTRLQVAIQQIERLQQQSDADVDVEALKEAAGDVPPPPENE